MSEAKLSKQIRDALCRGTMRLWRNTVGTGFQIRHRDQAVRQAIIARCIAVAEEMGGSASRVTFGLPEGSGDYIGLRTVLIEPEMVGCRIAQFASAEIKTITGAVRPDQVNWDRFMRQAGAHSGILRSVEQAREWSLTPFKPVDTVTGHDTPAEAK
jgi:hypothetical protein